MPNTPLIRCCRRIPLLTLALTAVMVAGMVYVVLTSKRTYDEHLPLVDAAMVARIEATLAHLALDEIATGRYGDDNVAELHRHMESAAWHLNAMRFGDAGRIWGDTHSHDHSQKWTYIPLHDPDLDQHLDRAMHFLATLRARLNNELPAIAASGFGAGANQEIEGLFHAYMISVDRMDERLHELLVQRVGATVNTQGLLIGAATVLGLLAALLLSRLDTERERANRRARANDRELINTVMNGVGEGIVAFDLSGRITTMNRAADAFLCPEHPEEKNSSVSDLCMGPCGGGRLEVSGILKRIHAVGGPVALEETRIDCEYTEPRLLSVIASPLRDETGALAGCVLSIRDVTERRRMEEALLASEERHERAQRIARLGHWDWHIKSNELVWSNEIFRMFGLDPIETEPTYELFLSMIHPEDREAVQGTVTTAMKSGEPYQVEHRVVLPDGETRVILEQGEVNYDRESRQPTHMMGTALDITDRKDLERKLEELATTDGLTGLFNRRHFDDRLDEEFRRAITYYNLPVSLLLIDVDRFKDLNDTHGHLAGDAWLVELATLLKRSVRSVDVVARYGGEELAVILPQTPGEQAVAMAERIRKAAEKMRVDWNGKPVRTTVSVGIADPRELDLPACEMLVEAADRALYQAKQAGRNQVVRAVAQHVPEESRKQRKPNTVWNKS